MENTQVMKTGTTTIGIMCKDGIILAADKRATMGSFIADKKSEKIHQIDENMALTTAGTVSDIQLITKLIKAELKLKQIRTGRKPSVKEAANLISGMIYSNIRKFSAIPGLSHFILGGMDDSGFHIYDLFVDGSLTECDDYVSSGSGSVMAYGVLETLYKSGITIKEGISLAVKSLNAALQRDSGSGNGVDVITITKEGYAKTFHKEIDTTVSA
jgi:proteasome beta subunit